LPLRLAVHLPSLPPLALELPPLNTTINELPPSFQPAWTICRCGYNDFTPRLGKTVVIATVKTRQRKPDDLAQRASAVAAERN
jgi:hypothetical protein